MHPNITSDRPGNCPICGMNLQKAEEGEKPVEKKEGEEGAVPGRSSFILSEERQQLIGVTTTQAELRELSREVRASGKVAFDPDLFTAIEEYRQAIQSQAQMSKSMFKDLREEAQQLVKSSETKLKLMGLNDEQIHAVAKKDADAMNLLLPKGMVWIYAEVFEYEVSGLKQGQGIEAHAPSIPGKIFLGTVSSISPILNTPTRTFRVRAEVPDPENVLRPDTFVNVKIKIEFGKRLTVPLDSVLHSGDQNFVFVVKEKGIFEPRMVQIGVKSQEYFEILSGISEGETVVTAANFLIDSESRLRNALKNIQKSGSSSSPEAPSSPQHQGHGGNP